MGKREKEEMVRERERAREREVRVKSQFSRSKQSARFAKTLLKNIF